MAGEPWLYYGLTMVQWFEPWSSYHGTTVVVEPLSNSASFTLVQFTKVDEWLSKSRARINAHLFPYKPYTAAAVNLIKLTLQLELNLYEHNSIFVYHAVIYLYIKQD